jgi:hypothetical protein
MTFDLCVINRQYVGTEMARLGNNPKRRLVPIEHIDEAAIKNLLSSARYVGSGHHKRYPLDYGFERTNPVPTKSMCDMRRPVGFADSTRLIKAGIRRGMVSDLSRGFPKYIWSVDADGIVYEAKTDQSANGGYHGYPLENDDVVRDYVLVEWKLRDGVELGN